MKTAPLVLLVLLFSACTNNPARDNTAPPAIETGSARDAKAEFEAFCASGPQPPCRENVAFTLVLDEQGNTQDFAFDLFPPPAQSNGVVTILPGETVYMSGDFVGGKLILPVVGFERPEGEHLAFTFEQQEGEPSMMLSVKNTYDQRIKYRALMMGPESEDLYKTSSCPVIAGGGAYEMWPHPIFQLMILEARTMDESDSMVCEW